MGVHHQQKGAVRHQKHDDGGGDTLWQTYRKLLKMTIDSSWIYPLKMVMFHRNSGFTH